MNSVEGTELCLVSGGNDNKVCVWSRRSHQLMLQFTEHIKPVVAVLPDAVNPHLLHSAGADRCVFTYDLKKEKRVVGHQVRARVLACSACRCTCGTTCDGGRGVRCVGGLLTDGRRGLPRVMADGQGGGGYLHGPVTAER